MAWWQNVETAWPELQRVCGEEFHRFWRYTLLSCAGFFRSREGQLWPVVLSRPERTSTYRSWRPAQSGALRAAAN
jgi:cyclopropane-fatty-acyl-phospholipid synthase